MGGVVSLYAAALTLIDGGTNDSPGNPCLGPYHKAFEAILEDITVIQKDEWDITVPSLT